LECCNKVGGINTPSHPTLYGSDIWRIVVQFRLCNLFPSVHLLSEAYFFYSLLVIVPKIPTEKNSDRYEKGVQHQSTITAMKTPDMMDYK